jgi:hypothetical protein
MSIKHVFRPQVILAFVKLPANLSFFLHNFFTTPISTTGLKYSIRSKTQNIQSASCDIIIGASVLSRRKVSFEIPFTTLLAVSNNSVPEILYSNGLSFKKHSFFEKIF